MENRLDFLVIGAQKCATTWIYECLYGHPEICMPKHKKEHEYIGGEAYKEKGAEWFFGLFSHCTGNKIHGQVSVEYIVNAESPKLLHDINPNMKFVLSVRNPADRAMSAIKWYIRKGTLSDNMNTIKSDLQNIIQNFSLKEYNMVQDEYDLLYRGFYNKLLGNYYQYFDRKNFLIVPYEDVKKDAGKALKDMYSFLGVDTGFVPAGIANKPKKNSNNKFLMKLERTFPKNKVVSKLVNIMHQRVASKETFSDAEIELRNMLDNFYKNHKELVETEQVHYV